VENILDEWTTGEHMRINFSGSSYSEKFVAHLAALEDYEEQQPQISKAWHEKLLRKAR
jgi:Domain of unknown function (DUF6532)